MRETLNRRLIVRASCPSCKRPSVFKFEDKKEKNRFRFFRHGCPRPDCRKKLLSNWEILR